MLCDADVLQALRVCYEPGYAANVVDLGGVAALAVAVDTEAPGYGIAGVPARVRVRLQLMPASAAEDGRALLEAQVRNRLLGMEGISGVEITVCDGWSAERISADGRKALGLGAFRILGQAR